MSVEKLDLAIANFIKAVAKVTNPHFVQCSVLQQANALLDNIISSLPVPVKLEDVALAPFQTLIHKCERLHDLLECLPNFQLKLILDIPLLTSDEHRYWYCCLLQSTYQCFKSLRICKLLHVTLNYYYDLMNHVSICLNQLQRKVGNVAMLLQLLRILYACLAGLPQETLEPLPLINAIIPYFKHEHKNVRISARNTAQFLISLVDEATKHVFLLSQECLYDLINASGKEMPTSSLLKLLLAYGHLPSNCSLYLAEGVFLFATKIAFQSSRDIDKKLAYAVIKMLAFHETNEEAKSIETKGENDPAHSQATPTSDIVVVNGVMADAKKDTDAKSFLNILPQLNEQVERFKAICLKRERDTDGRKIFKCLKEMLSLIKDQVSLLPEEPSKDINIMLSNILLDLLDALMMTDENQHIRWGNFIMFNCWIIIKALSGKSANTVLPNSQVSQLINKVLIAIPMFIERKVKNEIIIKSLLFFVELLKDILFGTISLTTLDDELLAIKNTLINSRVSSYGPLRVSTQIILSSLVTEDDHELVLKDLIVDEKIVAENIQQFSQLEDLKCVLLVLQKFNALSVIPENRATFRQLKLLPILERFSDKYSSTDVESLAAKLICSLLSDPPNDQQEENEPSNVIEKFVTTYLQEEKHSHSVYAGIKEMITATTDVMSSDVRSDDNIPQQILHHAECLYLVMTACSVEFHRVLYKSDEIVDISFLLKTSKLLKQLVDIYEDVPADSIILSTLERQVTYISTKHLPELASISFKAMKDAYSDSLSDFLKQTFFINLMAYLQHLHICIEQWSRMDINVKEVLIDYGAFHLLLNELHTAPTAKIVTDELVYFILTSFYNVVLIPELAKRFRISITKRLLSCYMSSEDVGTRCLAKFNMSCMHMLLSKSEISQISISSDEAEMMAKCLKGIDPFFGGHGNLETTIENLSHSPNNWQVFVDVGIVHSLVELALTETGSSRDCALGALLNMIPEPEIDSLKQHPFKKVIRVDNLSSPATPLLKTMPGFMELINTLSVTECKAIHLLLSLLKETRLEDIKVLYDAKRYTDCWQFCSHLLSDDKIDSKLKNKVLLYQAKCMYHTYNHEIMERIEQSDTMPGFEYKNMMRTFCNNRIVGIIKILTKLKSLALKANPAEQSVCSNSSTSPINNSLEHYVSLELEFYDNEADYMLDKALLDFLVYNTKEVRTCLLCHKATDNLIHSHYIPKSILQEFVKAMGVDPGASVFILAPPTDHPSDWHFKSAAKATLSMLCKKCDGEILSKDENLFKNNIFNIVYQRKCPGSHMLDCVITYGQYLYRFAVGLIFRNMAPLYSGICAEIGEFTQLHHFMQECRDVILAGTSTANLKIFMLFLPLELPAYLPQVSGWDKYVVMVNSPYAAYKLLQPGEPMVPKKIYCFMVKIGVMIFLIPLDAGLEMELESLCPFYQIHFSENQSVLLVPEDKERGSLIPEKLWWSFLGWAKKEVNRAMSVAISIKPPVDLSGKFHSGLLAKNILEGSSNSAAAQPVVANLLPPGFELNYDKHGTLPEKVIQVPEGHVILLHGHFRTSSGIKGYSILGRLESLNIQKVPEKPAIYSIMQWPYVLVYLEHSKKKYVLKTGFSVDEKDHKIRDALPGCPTSMKDSEHLRDLTEQIPDIIHGLLRSKGFRNLKSLIFWQESMKKHRTKDMFVPPLDTRCTNDRCIYCDIRCDVCLQPCLHRHKLETFPTLSLVQTCSEVCTTYLFSCRKECGVVKDKTKLADFSLKGHTEILYGSFSLDDVNYIGLKTHIFFSVVQSNDEAEGVLSIPSGLKYVKLWHHSIYKPLCIEYIIDDDFNAIELLTFKDSVSVFSPGEEKEMVHQFHEMLIRSGIVYQYFQNLPNDL